MPVGYKVDTVGAGRLTPVPPPLQGCIKETGPKVYKVYCATIKPAKLLRV